MKSTFKELITGSLLVISLFCVNHLHAQSSKTPYLDNPIILDSASSFLIPVQYDVSVFSSNKLAILGHYYANLIFYNVQSDSSKILFKKDTYIMDFRIPFYYTKSVHDHLQGTNRTKKCVILRVKDVDYNRNGRIDENDPDILYVTDNLGQKLRCLSTKNENVLSIQIFEKQNFALVKFQRDNNHNGKYDYRDDEYFYAKLDFATLTLGNKIELK
ncbi:MAG TPA: hypothetical protein PK325_03845 [Cyclobacteriaceae bacterium]|nr:hypothetical protein [Cyclobacteriaceae bacterium]HMV07381.1 hypothetical protein [Cyclobacteriaceae bacterium]HMV89015.1 hypothetical protein [Cyclobacteriaceae bacterium]HMW99264.1 hypothetical protein [Cyclobacteriaceae bacterium]HMX48947.1 hypothetical protein [Cyclobacteriaceae bacterium]